MTLPELFVKTARTQRRKLLFADSMGKEVSYFKALVGSILLAKALKSYPLGQHVGILMPSSVGGALINFALSLSGKITVNLNFTAALDVLNAAIAQVDMRYVITSRRFMEALGFQIKVPHILYIEDLMEGIAKRPLGKALAIIQACLPTHLLLKLLGGHRVQPQDVITILFSSGSTGTPKGIMLSHDQIQANCRAVLDIFPHSETDRFMGVLPFFHAFGYMATLWLPVLMHGAAVYHTDPRDAKTVGKMIQKYQATFMLGTPTFYRFYLRGCTKDQLASLRYAIAGAEKLPDQLADEFKDTFGVELLEGYGCTELGPAVCLNYPDIHGGTTRLKNTKRGTVGKPLPGVTLRVVDPQTGKELKEGKEGLIQVHSPALMVGYYHLKTDKVTPDGWYTTGDIGRVDSQGFLHLLDRLERFSKIAGEMVPHLKIEVAIREVLPLHEVSVVAVPDPSKGERLVLLYAHETLTAEDVHGGFQKTGLPNLWIPKQSSIHKISELPYLGSGKLDLRRLKELALKFERITP